MLKVLRDSMKYLAWILWAVIAVFVLFVFVDFGGSMPGRGNPSEAAVTIGDRDITYREFEREYRNLEEQMRQQLGDQYTPELAEQLRIPQQALNRIISRTVLLTEAERMGLRVTDAEVRREILGFPAFADSQGRFVGEQRYRQALARMGYTPDQFEAAIRQDLLIQRIYGALESSIVITPEQVEERYRQETERAKIEYVEVGPEAIDTAIEVSEEDLQSHFDAHLEEYRRPEQRRGQYLLVSPAAIAGASEPSEEEMRAYYEENRAFFSRPEQVRARHILVETGEGTSGSEARQRLEGARKRIEAGESFAAVAEEVSADPGTAARGGDLGYFGRGPMDPAFEEAAFAAEPGEIVGPVETSFGLHLIKVEDRRAAGQRPFEEVEPAVANRLRQQRAAQRAEEIAKELGSEIGEGEVSREELERLAAERPGVEFGTTEWFASDRLVPPLGRAPQLARAAFESEVGTVTEPLRLSRGWVLFRTGETRPPSTPDLEEVRERVRAAVEEEERSRLAVDRLERLRSEHDELGPIAAALGVEVQESQEFGDGRLVPGLGAAPAIVEQALTMEEGEIGGPVEHGDGAILFEVTERRRFDRAEFESERDRIRTELEQQQLQRLVSSLIAQRRQELGVDLDRQLVENFDLGGELS